MPIFRKRPVRIEAVQLDQENAEAVAQWCNGNLERTLSYGYDFVEALIIPTLEGDMRCAVGDWVVRGMAGEFYPVKDFIFESTYESVDDGLRETFSDDQW